MFQIAMIEDEEHTKQEVERLISREFEKLKVQDITTEEALRCSYLRY